MKMFIPHPGQMIRLTEDWKFTLYGEHRNTDLREALEVEYSKYVRGGPPQQAEVVLPKGTVLKISRLYIRGNMREYDSVTFWTVASPDGRLATKKNGGTGKGRRFWAKLTDVNNIEFEHVDELG